MLNIPQCRTTLLPEVRAFSKEPEAAAVSRDRHTGSAARHAAVFAVHRHLQHQTKATMKFLSPKC